MGVTALTGKWALTTLVTAEVPSLTRFEVDSQGAGVRVKIEGLGSISVDAHGCVVEAVDGLAATTILALGEDWAWGQWLAFNGTLPVHGATLERDGYGLALIGAPRSGTSLTALSLVNDGWRLVADGTCPLQASASQVIALPGRRFIEVDAMVTDNFPPAAGFEPAATPRRRSHIPAVGAGSTAVHRIIEIVPTHLRDDGVIVDSEVDPQKQGGRLWDQSVVGLALQSANPSLTQRLTSICDDVVALLRVDVALVPAGKPGHHFSPKQVAALIEADIAKRADAFDSGSDS